jgi:amino acid adenylation domain-containing protein
MNERVIGFEPLPEDIEECGFSAWFVRQVERDPDAIAIEDGHGAITRAQMDAGASDLMALLSRTGRGGPIALLLPHGARAAIAVVAALRTDEICVPLDLTHPATRLRAVLQATEPSAIVTDEAHRALVEELAAGRSRVVTIEEAAGAARGEPGRHVPYDANRPAYMLFTSGSSGPPKGIVHAQRCLVHRARCHVNCLNIGRRDRLTWFAVAATGQGTHNLLAALTSGAVLIPYAPREEGLGAIPELLREERITIMNASATLFRTLAQMLRPGDVFPDIRVVRLGSERVRRGDVELARAHFPNARFVNLYSSTETSSVAIHCIDPHEPLPDDDEVPVGRPLPGYEIRVVDEDAREVPPGQDGEIVVQSQYLAIGYWKNPEQTSAVFRSGAPGEARSFFTRDRGRLRADGTLLHLGRLDSRVKIRGHRVELDEIERIIATHPAVRHAAVFVMRSADGEDQLVACVSGDAARSVPPTELRMFLNGLLPHQVLPTAITWLPDLPTTISGKADLEALRRLHRERAAAGEATVDESATELEREVMALWREALGITRVAMTDDFLTIGGDSLRAGRLLAHVFDRWSVDISFADFLEDPTIPGLARCIEERTPPREP